MSRVALRVAYDGTELAGWQAQDGLRTVQGELEAALGTLFGRRVAVHGAGRTDAGVHARGQVAHVDPPRALPGRAPLSHRLNALLPEDVRVLGQADVPADFHARRQARGKTYRYQLHVAPVACPVTRRHRVHVPVALDLEAMADAAQRFAGRRDFAALRTLGSSARTTVREIRRCALEGRPPAVDVVVEGDGFLRHMVRAIAGCLLEVGRGRREPRWIEEVLASGQRARAAANAPPHGLVLEEVRYEPAPVFRSPAGESPA